jgi:hypothetical protein
MRVFHRLAGFAAGCIPALALAQESMSGVQRSAGNAGVSGLWVLANICYAGMKAQGHPSMGWRMLSFIFGFPGTLITFLIVDEGGERAYGIEIPKKR